MFLLLSLSWQLCIGDPSPKADSDVSALLQLHSIAAETETQGGGEAEVEVDGGCGNTATTLELKRSAHDDDSGARGCSVRPSGQESMIYKETHGELPLFVDAFLDASQTSATVIFNMNIWMKQNVWRDPGVQKTFYNATWHCDWSRSTRILALGASEVAALSVYGAVIQVSEPSDSPDEPEHPKEDAHHHSLVLRCPKPEGASNVLSLVAKDSKTGTTLYEREEIHVCAEDLLAKPFSAVACTMTTSQPQVASEIVPWVEHHLLVGFEHIVVYVEDADDSPIRERLEKFISRGHVTLVNFWFSNVSAVRKFRMQQAQETHCLYRAKGTVRWLGHMDIDEYFQLRGPTEDISHWLDSVVNHSEISAIRARSALWWAPAAKDTQGAADASKDTEASLNESNNRALVAEHSAGYPCQITCKQNHPAYFGWERTKLIMNPDTVTYFSVHMLTVYDKAVYIANPDTELRLNHFQDPFYQDPHAIHFNCKEELLFRESPICRFRQGRESSLSKCVKNRVL